MRHERIPIEVKLAKDALKCRPSTPAYDNAIMGMPQRNGTAQDAANVPTTTSALRQGGRWGGGDLGSEMDWLVMEGGEDSMHDDPLTSLLVRAPYHEVQLRVKLGDPATSHDVEHPQAVLMSLTFLQPTSFFRTWNR